jgi:hypothetical protein
MSEDTFQTSSRSVMVPPESAGCRHDKFKSKVKVVATEDGFYMAEVTIQCKRCGHPFRFKGLPRGLNMGGAAVSPLDTELRAAIEPLSTDPIGRKVKI